MAHKDFDRFGDVHLARSQGDFIQCDLPRPKHEFLRYLRDERGAVLHRSNNPDIIILEPRAATGTGLNQTLGAVYILDGGLFEERGNYVCFEEVRPLGKLRVEADDLAILDQSRSARSSKRMKPFASYANGSEIWQERCS